MGKKKGQRSHKKKSKQPPPNKKAPPLPTDLVEAPETDREGQYWMDGCFQIDPEHFPPFTGYLPLEALTSRNLPPFHRKQCDEQVYALKALTEVKGREKLPKLLLGVFWCLDFDEKGEIRKDRRSLPLADVKDIINPQLPIHSHASAGRPMKTLRFEVWPGGIRTKDTKPEIYYKLYQAEGYPMKQLYPENWPYLLIGLRPENHGSAGMKLLLSRDGIINQPSREQLVGKINQVRADMDVWKNKWEGDEAVAKAWKQRDGEDAIKGLEDQMRAVMALYAVVRVLETFLDELRKRDEETLDKDGGGEENTGEEISGQ
ncbi:hypothetical protein FQN50_002421 [Emmonsiellopsis sp. PD_5]|nr:hypothetical protein FQN50_002421 [Emmonsiellopsis sp. PD_5]